MKDMLDITVRPTPPPSGGGYFLSRLDFAPTDGRGPARAEVKVEVGGSDGGWAIWGSVTQAKRWRRLMDKAIRRAQEINQGGH